MIYQHPLAYLMAMEGRALLRAWAGDDGYDRGFVEDRLLEIRRLLDDEALSAQPGVEVEPGATAAAYERWSDHYDNPGNGLFDLDAPLIEEIVAALPVGTAVDVGCGTGRVTAGLVDRGHRVVGFDASAAMLQHARRRLPRTAFVRAELQQLPLAADTTDLLVTALALTHVPDLRPVLAEFARVLRPGGHAVVSDVHHDLVLLGSVVASLAPDGRPQRASTSRHTTADFLRAALAAGFEIRAYEEEPRRDHGAAGPPPEPSSGVGSWADWPWTLLGLVPEATQAAWDAPAVVVWHLQLPLRAGGEGRGEQPRRAAVRPE